MAWSVVDRQGQSRQIASRPGLAKHRKEFSFIHVHGLLWHVAAG
jgi:hypothetical protein